jgi:hypothetical protein
MRNRKKMFLIAPFAIVGIAAFIALGGWIVMHLWNWLLPTLFGWKLITFWQALALLVLCRILFGGFGGHRSHGFGMRRRVQERMGDRAGILTPEEREEWSRGVRERMRERMGFPPTEPEAQGK